MNIKDFKETNENKQKEMDNKLSEFKLEDIKSLWYFVVSSSKATIMGSKN